MQWWGYLHTNGSIQVKRFFGREDIIEAMDSPFVDMTFGPFEVDGREEAIQKIKDELGR